MFQNGSWNWASSGPQNKPKHCPKMGSGTGLILGVKLGSKIVPKWVLEVGQFWVPNEPKQFPKWVLELG